MSVQDGNCVRNLNLVPFINETGPGLVSSVFHILNQTRTRFGARYSMFYAILFGDRNICFVTFSGFYVHGFYVRWLAVI